MKRNLVILSIIAALTALIAACSRDTQPTEGADLLRHVPADTPYVMVSRRDLPPGLREKLGDYYAAQLALQRGGVARLRAHFDVPDPDRPAEVPIARVLDIIDAILVEFDGRTTAAALRELGIEPVGRSVIYGIGILPALRMEIADAQRLNAMLDRVEQRAELQVEHATLNDQAYRRFDLGSVDLLLSVVGDHAIAGLLPDTLVERELPLLLGQAAPPHSLADSGKIDALIERHGLSGYGEGYIELDTLAAMLLGRSDGHNAMVMQALGTMDMPLTPGCGALVQSLVAGMPRMVAGVTQADDSRLALRSIWEGTPAVAAYLQKLAAPVPGVGAPDQGLVSMGIGIDLAQLRNAVEALLRQIITAGGACEWVEPDKLEAMIPQLNLALGPMTAGIKGFNLRLDDLRLDPETMEPRQLKAGLLAAVDDPRGVFALGAMFNPGLAALQIPSDGTPVDLSPVLGLDPGLPALKVAIQDKKLLLLGGDESAPLAQTLAAAPFAEPPPLLAISYDVRELVARFGPAADQAIERLRLQGQAETGDEADTRLTTDAADDLADELAGLRLQSRLYERLSLSMYADAQGLIVDQVMLLD